MKEFERMEMSTKKAVFLALSVSAMGALLAAAVFGQSVQNDSVYKYLSVFSEVFSIVSNNYVDEVPPTDLVDGAFTGVTQAVDEFSYYVSPADMPSYKEFLDAEDQVESGLVLTKRFGYAFVIGVVKGSPADVAELKPGDLIERIGDRVTEELEIWEAVAGLRGHEGETRALVVVKAGSTTRDEVTLTLTKPEPLPFDKKEFGRVVLLKVPDFREGTAARLDATLGELREKSPTALILDLRGNAAGDIEEAIRAADLFLSSGTITSVAGRKAEKQVWQADRDTAFDAELLVLTDSSCAAGAEVFAAAISGNERGRVVGLTTYGRAIVQKLIELPSGGGLYLTIGHYTRPDLEPILKEGVRPDVAVERSDWDSLPSGDESAEPRDPILEKALALIESEVEEKAAA